MNVVKDIMRLIPPEHMPPKKYLYLDIVYRWQNIDTLKSERVQVRPYMDIPGYLDTSYG